MTYATYKLIILACFRVHYDIIHVHMELAKKPFDL